MLLTITLNPCVDKSTAVPLLEPEAKLRCTQMVNEPGGGGINVSKALKKLDLDALALFPAGGHNGRMLCGLLADAGISHHAVECSVETRENWVVFESDTAKQFRLTFPGNPVKEDTIARLIDEIRAYSPEYVIASGSLPPGLPHHFYASIVETATAAGSRCIVDTGGPALRALAGKKAFLIKPNVSELCRLLQVEKLAQNEVDDAALQVVSEGYAENVAVSMGPAGAWLVNAQEKHFVKAPVVKRVSTVGAGDSMVAGMTAMLCQGRSLREAVAFGVACGSAATMNPGTRLFNKEDAWRLFESIV
jgi:6-phosphofructokinase 2